MPCTILITGAGSGIGHGFAKHYLQQPDTTVIAADRSFTLDLDPPSSQPNNTQLHKLDLEMTSLESIDALIASIKGLSHEHQHLDLIIHSAGIRGLVPAIVSSQPHDVAAAETLQVMDSDTMLRTFEVNTLGTFNLLQRLHQANLFYPPPPSSPNANITSETTPGPTKIIIMTSRMGSISHNTIGAGYAYRASKAALNAIVKSMSIDLPHVCFLLVHPGRVETGLTVCREEGAIEVGESVADMVGLIEGVELGLGAGDSGGYVDRWGGRIGW